ncbi:ArsR family transcriptional regulator [Patescibacteria group bacterium]|nr:MAG: ArsR family transcriptional regulator [Patescibacteria group bacterium]
MNPDLRIIRAFANARRIEIIKKLQTSGSFTVTGLAREIGLSFRSTSKHLQRLDNANLLESSRQANAIWYRLRESLPDLAQAVLNHLR